MNAEVKYSVKDVYGNVWKMTQQEFDEMTREGVPLRMNKGAGNIVRNKHWVHLQDTQCPYLD